MQFFVKSKEFSLLFYFFKCYIFLFNSVKISNYMSFMKYSLTLLKIKLLMAEYVSSHFAPILQHKRKYLSNKYILGKVKKNSVHDFLIDGLLLWFFM